MCFVMHIAGQPAEAGVRLNEAPVRQAIRK